MNIEIRIVATKEYYKEFYAEFLKRNKLKKWEPLLATGLVIFGLVLYLLNSNESLWFIPWFFIIAGFYEFFKVNYSKKKWLNDRLKSNISNQELQLIFTDSLIKHIGPFSTGNIKWEGIQRSALTKNGLFLIPENGTSIYLPKKAFNSATDLNLIIEKLKATSNSGKAAR